jgi:ABC-type glutathione transport system ATPase component
MTHLIPLDALDDRLAIVGTSGSGKTYAAGTAVEIVLSTTRPPPAAFRCADRRVRRWPDRADNARPPS